MKFLFKQLLLALLLIIVNNIYAQVQNVKFDLFTGTNGVALGKINAMVRDKYGFLWMSDQSNSCIIRFDGSHMTRYQYNPHDPNSLGGYYPECLASDSSGNIWIGFYGMGLDKFDPVANKFIHYHHNDRDSTSLSNDFVAAVLVDHLGNVWVGNYKGLDLLDQKTGKFKHYSHKDNNPASLSCDTVRALYEDKAGEIWVGTGFAFFEYNTNGGLNLFHRDNNNNNEAILIAKDIKANEQKINHHGKRADAIVKNMLQHSKQTKGTKEPTDINALCEEYLRLSYHGMRAKDKSFNADFKTNFDESIGKINIIPQDIGRVLLNLLNNAFYAVNEKKKLLANSYQPLAEVKTRRINDKVEIIVSDNGNGIPQKVLNKIFQPFFTTKPTGEGTGLGLSLSYDIIKAHGGEIKVETKEGEGSEFIIQLPLTKTS